METNKPAFRKQNKNEKRTYNSASSINFIVDYYG